MLNEPLSQYEKDAYQNDIDSPSVSFTLFGAYRDNSATSLFLRETICKASFGSFFGYINR